MDGFSGLGFLFPVFPAVPVLFFDNDEDLVRFETVFDHAGTVVFAVTDLGKRFTRDLFTRDAQRNARRIDHDGFCRDLADRIFKADRFFVRIECLTR